MGPFECYFRRWWLFSANWTSLLEGEVLLLPSFGFCLIEWTGIHIGSHDGIHENSQKVNLFCFWCRESLHIFSRPLAGCASSGRWVRLGVQADIDLTVSCSITCSWMPLPKTSVRKHQVPVSSWYWRNVGCSPGEQGMYSATHRVLISFTSQLQGSCWAVSGFCSLGCELSLQCFWQLYSSSSSLISERVYLVFEPCSISTICMKLLSFLLII